MSEDGDIDVENTADDRTENPTEISDVTLLHPDDFASYLEDTTQFQIEVMLAIQNLSVRGEQCYGLAIKGELEEYYGVEEIHHGRLYPNLDTLKERGFIRKTEIDKRSNSYQLTPTGKGFLKKFAEHTVGLINGQEYDEVMRA